MATILITGGTGSFGRAFVNVIRQINAVDIAGVDKFDIRVFSRDEQKQDQMKKELNDPRVRYLLGDVRDGDRVRRACRGVDYVIHAAALKIIPAGEYNPDEVIKTNVLGTDNVIEAAVSSGVLSVAVISSDKAVAPVNLYGNTKACAEKLATLANSFSGDTSISVFRYGNVIGSRGSILTLLKNKAKTGTIQLTHPEMTRFWISLDKAAKFVFEGLTQMKGGEIFIPKMESCYLRELVAALFPEAKIEYVGLRPGEKIHEWLTNEYEVVEERDGCWVVDPNGWSYDQPPISSGSEPWRVPAQQIIDTYFNEVQEALRAPEVRST